MSVFIYVSTIGVFIMKSIGTHFYFELMKT